MPAISSKMVGQPDNLNSLYTPDEIKAMLDLPPEEVRVFLNSFITLLGSTSVDNWLYQQIVGAVLNGVADNSLTDIKLSDAVGQIKDRFAQHIVEAITDANLSDAAGQIKDRVSTHTALSASETVVAHVELATATETTTGTDNTRAVHPAGLKVVTDLLIPLTKSTWEKIAEQTLGSSVAQVDFISIPSGYKNFRVEFDAISSAAALANMLLTFNSDTTAGNYRYRGNQTGSASVGVVGSTSAANIILTSALAYNTQPFSYGFIEISNVNPLIAKRVVGAHYSETTGPDVLFNSIGGVWTNVSNEINKISFAASANLIGAGSHFTLWGCK